MVDIKKYWSGAPFFYPGKDNSSPIITGFFATALFTLLPPVPKKDLWIWSHMQVRPSCKDGRFISLMDVSEPGRVFFTAMVSWSSKEF